MKKFLSFVFFSAMLVSITVSGCHSYKVISESKDSVKSDDTTNKPSKITAMVDIFLPQEQGHKEFIDEYKRQTGIDLEIIMPQHNQYYNLISVMFASNNIPDVIELGDQNYMNYATKDALVDLMPYVKSGRAEENISKTYMDALTIGGKLYGFPLTNGGGCVTYIRKDWLDRLGLSIPENYNELCDVMRAFTDNDPDGNGINDTYGYTGVLYSEGKLQDFYMKDFFQKGTSDFCLKNGRWQDGFTQSEFREGLNRLKKAYSDGIVDPQIFTNQTSICRDKLSMGRVGIFSYWGNYWAVRLEESIRNTSDSNARLIAINPISESEYLNRVPIATSITKKAQNPEGIYKWFIDYMHDGNIGQTLFVYGVENVHWRKLDNKAQFLPKLNNSKEVFDKAYFSEDTSPTVFEFGSLIPLDSRITAAKKAQLSNFRQLTLLPPSNTYTSVYSEVQKLKMDIASQIISGEVGCEEGMLNYGREVQILGLDKILREFNESAK